MHSLYWRIFLAFWVALGLILVGTVTVAVNATAHRADRPGLQRGQLYGQAARAFETGGPAALEDWLRSLPAEPFGRTFIIEPGGREMLRRPLPPSSSGANDAARAPAPGTAAGAIAPLGAGDLNVRVLPALKGRQDDLGLLAADLDSMAERLRLLLEAKQQLLRDVSHELRSPLARLQLALSLASREPSGVERHLARIAREAERLEQLIARTLKLASLE